MKLIKHAVLLVALCSVVARAEPSVPFIGDLWSGIGEIGQDIIDGIRNATQEGADIAGDFLHHFQNATDEFVGDAKEYSQSVLEELHDGVVKGLASFARNVLLTLENLQQTISKVSNNIKRQVLQDALDVLVRINATATELETDVANIGIELQQRIESHRAEIETVLNQWSKSQLDTVDQETDGAGVKEAEQLINELVLRYGTYLNSCAEEVELRKVGFELQVSDVIEQYHNATTALAIQIDSCLRSTNSGRSARNCRNGVQGALANLIQAPKNLEDLKAAGAQLISSGLQGSVCVVQTLQELANEKLSVEIKIDIIIGQNKKAPEYDSTTLPIGSE
ncbi:uncharacterized protein LOC115625831 [Scaptodrosophila lebanonensis]|uniref:Uncharacterized protein LOC115625831 n=1 Tax=Drosophila lebanonensis TaxID=7225 RepID=A0A6J2TMZ6_DROLE|nr:uncharacterized protein LOC115625831 [Scaptodrosophila lebanonensis]